MDDPCRKISELESENAQLREKLSILGRNRSPLAQLPTPPRIPGDAVPRQDPDATDSPQPTAEQDPAQVLHYLKTALGFTIKYMDNTIVLRSVYSFCEEDIFEIEVKNNKLILKNTPYLGEWGEYLNRYVRMGKSYSAFFAAVTLDLFNKKTFG